MSERSPDSGSDCCSTPDPRIARHFDKWTANVTAGGQFPEMADVSRGLLSLLADVATERPTLLELGCGTGAMSVTLLEKGAVRADGVDLSPNSIATATRRAESAGVGERSRFVVGDGSVLPLERHDWVVMDRVMCCFADVDRLLGNAIGAASRRVAFTVPESRGAWGIFNRIFWGFEALVARLWPTGCPGYVHSTDLMGRRLSESGFELLRDRRMGIWYAAVWQKP